MLITSKLLFLCRLRRTAPSETKACIRFSTYVIDEKGKTPTIGKILPATKWYWALDDSFHAMLARTTQHYRETYADGGWLADSREYEHVGEEVTMKVVAEISLFFLAACVWFKQKVLVSNPGHIERHARKRYVKRHELFGTAVRPRHRPA